MPGEYTLTNSAHDVNNWAGTEILMPDGNFTICFWVRMDMWNSIGRSTLLSIATEGKSVYCYFVLICNYFKKPFYLIFIQYHRIYAYAYI